MILKSSLSDKISQKETVVNLRIDSLDYLRGLAAFGIMIYHMYLFTYGETDSSHVLAKIKIYGVSIFYVLSGLTLYLVNIHKFSPTKNFLKDFYIKRFFRIVPLLWMATALTLIVSFDPSFITLKKLIANITIIPGAIKPETFIANGAWSIGDELFFYFVFPFILFIIIYNKWWFYIFNLFAFFLLSYFTFVKLNPNIPLGLQWAAYVNPLGQLFYFSTGIALGVADKTKRTFGWQAIFGVVILGFLIVVYPVSGEPVQLVTGINRLFLSFYVITFCFFFYKCDFSFLPNFIKSILRILGEISFSVYLIHPIIYVLLKNYTGGIFTNKQILLISLTILSTLFLSYLSYIYFEKYFIKLGKKFTVKASF